MGRRAAPGRRRGGGEVVPALGTPGARVAAAAGALLALVALAAYPAAAADRLAGPLAAGGAAAVILLALGLATRLPLLVPPALALAGAEYVGVLYLGGDARALPIAAGGLVLAAELAYWALEPAPAAAAAPRAATVLLAAVAGGAAAALIASVSNEDVTGGLGLETAGVAAAVTALAVVVALARARTSE